MSDSPSRRTSIAVSPPVLCKWPTCFGPWSRLAENYETAAAARRAVGMVSRLVTLSDSEFVVKPILWRFDVLESPHLARAAARDIRGADLLVLATNETKALPADAQRWLDDCFADLRGERPATVGLFGPDDDWSILS